MSFFSCDVVYEIFFSDFSVVGFSWLDFGCRLVDTRDIVELELKQKDYELVIRKKEALPPPPAPQHSSPGPHIMAHTMFPGYQPQAQPQPLQEAPSSPSAPAAPAPVPDAIPLAAEHPPMLSPMAGTFYKCPGPGEPPYVKVCV
jgi:acetyl-CoA carboxylase biotin carboxyl carrier protein